MFNQLVAAGAAADYVLLSETPGGAAALLATNSYAQVWVYDLSSGADPWDADFEAIADWWVDESSGEIIADGRILGTTSKTSVQLAVGSCSPPTTTFSRTSGRTKLAR